MSDAGLLGASIYSSQMKEIASLKIAYITNELAGLQTKAENLQEKKSEYEEVKKYLIGEDKEDTVQYRLVAAEIKDLDRQIESIEDEETNMTFLKEQWEVQDQNFASQATSFQTAADSSIKKSYSVK